MRKPRNKSNFAEYSIIKGYILREKSFEKNRGYGSLDVALIFPSNYPVAIGNLGFHKIFQLINQIRGVNCERFTYEESFSKFYSLDTQRPLDEFKIWGFSVHFEPDFLNIIQLLQKKAIPLRSRDRKEEHPIILIGGSVTFFNANPLWELADIIYYGDAEEGLTEVIAELLNSQLEKKSREASLRSLLSFPFLSIPPLEKQNTTIAHFANLAEKPSSSLFLHPAGSFGIKALIEVGRGCIRKCAFCATGHTRNPARFLPFSVLQERIEFFSRNGTNRLGFISATPTDYPELPELLDYLEVHDVLYSFSSIRVDSLTGRLLDGLKYAERNSITIAPEGATEKMRTILGKGISDQQLFSAIELISNKGFKKIKLYCLYGIEEEQATDLDGFKTIVDHCRKLGFRNIHLSFNPLIPKPRTPFETRPMQSIEVLKRKKAYLINSLSGECETTFESLKSSRLQYLLGKADRNTSRVLTEAKNTELSIDQWIQAIEADKNSV